MPVGKTRAGGSRLAVRYDAIVVGTGIGGSVASAVLASEGLRVLVLEKNRRVGGVCASYEKHGFKVDVGTHMFSRGARGPLARIGRRVRARPIEFVQTRDLALVCVYGAKLRLPRDAYRYPAFVAQAIRAFKLRPLEVVQAARFFHEMVNFDEARLPELDRVTMWDFVTSYTKNPRLVGVFGLLLGLYFILPLKQVGAGEGIWCFKRMVRDRGLSYPRGGCDAVPEAFLEAARRRGATTLTRQEVTRVRVESGMVRGVECADGSVFDAPVVVSTTTLKDLVDRLVGPAHLPAAYVERVRSLRGSMVAVQAKIALRRPLVSAGCLVALTGDIDLDNLQLDDIDRLYGEVRSGKVADVTPIYAPVPTNFDASLAPDGAQLITACAVAPTTDIDLVDAPQLWVDNMMRALRGLLPGLDDALLWVDTWTVAAIGQWAGKLHAPAVSTGQVTGQVGNHRPPVRTPIRGLYACGCNAGARGIGTELAAASGEQAADAVVCDLVNGLLPEATV